MKLSAKTRLILWGTVFITMLVSLKVKATEPGASVENLVIKSNGSTRYSLNWDWPSWATPPESYLIIMKTRGPATATPTDGVSYSNGQSFGGGEVFVIMPGTGSDGVTPVEGLGFSRTSLTEEGVDYWFTVYPYNGSGANTDYRGSNPGEFAFVTPGVVEEPMMQPYFISSSVGALENNAHPVVFSFDKSEYELEHPFETKYLIVYNINEEVSYNPMDGNPDATSSTSWTNLSDGSKARLDQGGVNESVNINVTSEIQFVYFKIFSINKAKSGNSLSTTDANQSSNYLTTDPLTFVAEIPASPNQAPVINDALFTIDENSSNGTDVGTVTGEDGDGDAITYSIIAGNDGDPFLISATSGTISVLNETSMDYESTPTFELTVQGDDGNGGTHTASVTITLNNLNDNAPEIADQHFSLDENSGAGIQVGTISATDADEGALAFSISSGNTSGTFTIDSESGLLSVNEPDLLNYESNTHFSFEVSVSDGIFESTASITVNINDVNEAPEINGDSYFIDENSASGTFIGQILGSDPDQDNLTYSIESGNDQNSFVIDQNAGTLRVNDPALLDFEVNTSFQLTIKVRDDEGLSDQESYNINLNNVNDNIPYIDDQRYTLDEHAAIGTVLGTISGQDDDGDDLSYNISSGNSNSAFAIGSTSGLLTVNNSNALDFESNPEFELIISVSDGLFSNTASVVVTLNDIEENGAPIINNHSFTIIESIENGDLVGTVQAQDNQGDAITYSITSGNEDAAFDIDQTSGAITINDRARLNFIPGAEIFLSVDASDGNASNQATVNIILNNAPLFNWSATTFNKNENENWQIEVPVSDAEGDDLSLSIESGNTNELFEVVLDAANWVIQPTDPENGIDFEMHQSFELIFNAADALGNSTFSESIEIVINNINDNAPQATNETINIDQFTPNGRSITFVEATDVDGDALNFSIISGNIDDAFFIHGVTGEISVNNSDALEFAINPQFELTVEVSDGKFSTNAIITINIDESDTNSAPVIADQTFVLEENSVNGTSVGLVEASDDDDDALTYSIVSGNLEDAFVIGSSSGELIVTNSAALDFETTPEFNLVISVSDGLLSELAIVTIELTDLEEEVVTSIEDIGEMALSVFPNPAKDYFRINQNDQVKAIQIIDQSGRTLVIFQPNTTNSYNISQFQTGHYVLRIHTLKTIHNTRLIIQ